jgi:hypothetical protein
MKIDLGSGEFASPTTIRCRPARRTRSATIVCTAGTIWLTVEGEAGDVFLRPAKAIALSVTDWR